MRMENFPEPVSDPEREGLPATADDDSYAWDAVESVREADGPDPASLPSDQPLGMTQFGTTLDEARQGESLSRKLGREVPDPASQNAGTRRDAARRYTDEAFDAEPENEDVDAVDPDTSLDDVSTIDAWTDSPVSLYDEDRPGYVGRLVEPDEGAHEDDEDEAIAYDAGPAGGGPTAEELAMHEVPED
jgi:Family of unknown function (DUF5709)